MRMRAENQKTEMRPDQPGSVISILGVGVLGILRSLRILGWKTENKTSPAQRDSENSRLAIRPLCPYCPLCPLDLKPSPAGQSYAIR
jgi:hypothetical protein